MRISSGLCAVMMLAACDRSAPPSDPVAEARERIDCAIDGTAEYRRLCTIERGEQGDATILTIRHPDGGFHRLRVTDDDSVEAADGAEAAVVVRSDASIDVAIGGTRYRLPIAAVRLR